MTVAFDLQKSAALPPVYVGAVAAIPPGQPLTITCAGEVQHVEDDPALGTWWQQQTLTVGHCASIAEAIAFASYAVEHGGVPLGDHEALGFSPRLFVILDRDLRLVLAGEICTSDIRWCAPVASDTEARQVVEFASRIRAEASYEMGWDNYSTAKRLRHEASVLEGRLVDPFWRDEVRRALKETV